MDLVANYARTYGGPPRPDQPWHEVLALARRVGRFDARDLLTVFDGTRLSQPAENETIRAMQISALRKIAHPEEERRDGV